MAQSPEYKTGPKEKANGETDEEKCQHLSGLQKLNEGQSQVLYRFPEHSMVLPGAPLTGALSWPPVWFTNSGCGHGDQWEWEHKEDTCCLGVWHGH